MENTIKEKSITNVYDEVYGILKALGENFIKKVPEKEMKYIVSNMTYKIVDGKKKYHIPKYDLKVSLNLQKISKEAISIIYYLYSNYWCKSENERLYIKKIISNNESILENKKKEQYNPDKLFDNKVKIVTDNVTEENMLVPIQKQKWYKKIFEKISQIFKNK